MLECKELRQSIGEYQKIPQLEMCKGHFKAQIQISNEITRDYHYLLFRQLQETTPGKPKERFTPKNKKPRQVRFHLFGGTQKPSRKAKRKRFTIFTCNAKIKSQKGFIFCAPHPPSGSPAPAGERSETPCAQG